MTFKKIFYFFYVENMFLSLDDYSQRLQRKGVRKSGKAVGQKTPEPCERRREGKENGCLTHSVPNNPLLSLEEHSNVRHTRVF